jgi:LysR family transcriptional regulator, nitrogen assimilation regulatory protein
MDLKHLKSFLAVYEEGSFSKAAAKLNSTQPGISVQIAALEGELDAKLFERHARGINPTVAGERFYKRGIQIIHDTNNAMEEIKALAGTVSGTVAAGIPPTLSTAVLAPVLSQYVEQFPNVEIRVVEGYSTTLLSHLEKRELDFAFVTHVPDHPAISFQALYEDHFVVVSGTPLDLKPNKAIRLDRPPYLKIIIPSLRHGLHRMLDVPMETGRIVPARLIEIDGLTGTLEFVSKAPWAALLPIVSVQPSLLKTKLRVNEIAGDPIKINYFKAHASTEPMSLASRSFVAIVQTELDRIARERIELTRVRSKVPSAS